MKYLMFPVGLVGVVCGIATMIASFGSPADGSLFNEGKMAFGFLTLITNGLVATVSLALIKS